MKIYEQFSIKLKAALSEKGFTQEGLAKELGVTRSTISEWLNGKIPSGKHLLKLAWVLKLSLDSFFSYQEESISVPQHRLKGNAKLKHEYIDEAIELAKNFLFLFSELDEPDYSGQISFHGKTKDVAIKIAKILRERVSVPKDKPISYGNVFEIAAKLGIFIVFVDFEKTSSYAAHTQILKHNVIMVNKKTNMLDLIFIVLHEIGHSICADNLNGDVNGIDEEKFCDLIASYTQLPEPYIDNIYEACSGEKPANIINTLKIYSRENYHAMYGVFKRIKEKYKDDLSLQKVKNIGGANTNLVKTFYSLEKIFTETNNPFEYIELFKNLSPKYFDAILKKIEEKKITKRRLAELILYNPKILIDEIYAVLKYKEEI